MRCAQHVLELLERRIRRGSVSIAAAPSPTAPNVDARAANVASSSSGDFESM
jgi:hypothetical protein